MPRRQNECGPTWKCRYRRSQVISQALTENTVRTRGQVRSVFLENAAGDDENSLVPVQSLEFPRVEAGKLKNLGRCGNGTDEENRDLKKSLHGSFPR